MRRVVALVAVALTACGSDGGDPSAEPRFTTADAIDLCVESVQYWLDYEDDDPAAWSDATAKRAQARCARMLDDGAN